MQMQLVQNPEHMQDPLHVNLLMCPIHLHPHRGTPLGKEKSVMQNNSYKPLLKYIGKYSTSKSNDNTLIQL